MTVERIHPKAPVMLIFIAIFTCLLSCINLSNTDLVDISQYSKIKRGYKYIFTNIDILANMHMLFH